MSEFVDARDGCAAGHRRRRMQDICHTAPAHGRAPEIEKALGPVGTKGFEFGGLGLRRKMPWKPRQL
jgi:hypothetical protein